MYLNDLLKEKGIAITKNSVLVMRHTPKERELNKKFLSIAESRPDLFNAYQSTQSNITNENQFKKARFLAAFIGHEPRKAIFVGMYRIGDNTPWTSTKYWKDRANTELMALGMKGFNGSRETILKFQLEELDTFQGWKGKLVIDWPGKELAWSRWADVNRFFVSALLEESKLAKAMPDWTEIVWRYQELKSLPRSWEERMSQWRGIYFIYDTASKKGYVGSAYGVENIIGRWRNYRRTGHGGNKHLRKCKPENLIFSILEIDSHVRAPNEIIKKETSWKERLHTRYPSGLNAN